MTESSEAWLGDRPQKLQVRLKEGLFNPGGTGLMLCDDSGVCLPGQTKATLTTGIDDLPRLTVEFVIDGDDVRLIKSGG